MRPKDIGTRFETRVVRYLQEHGFGTAERRALHGAVDLGDITGTPGVVWECKAGEAAMTASDARVQAWLEETERERAAAGAAYGVLVLQRRGMGLLRIGDSWAIFPAALMPIHARELKALGPVPVRLQLSTAVQLLRQTGYGDSLGSTVHGSQNEHGGMTA